MIVNKLVLIYFLLLFISLFVGALAAATGLWVHFRSPHVHTHESRRHLEKYLYLSTSAMMSGAIVRLMMVPLWFISLHRLIPTIPGAMCLAGVHLNVPVYSWLASGMKLILPGLYLSWLIISMADRRMAEQPFLRLRQLLLIPLLVLLFAESALDFYFFSALKPTPVTCCTAIFDFSAPNVPPLLTESHWYFVFLFLPSLVCQIVLLQIKSPRTWIQSGIIVLAALLFISLLMAMHTKLSPLILDTPFHHCVFCLLQSNTWVLIGFAAIMAGIYLSVTNGLLGLAGRQTSMAGPLVHKLTRIILILYGLGTMCIGGPAIEQM